MLPLTRREFLIRLSALGGGVAASSMFDALAAVPVVRGPLAVVLSRGLAGLDAPLVPPAPGGRAALTPAAAAFTPETPAFVANLPPAGRFA